MRFFSLALLSMFAFAPPALHADSSLQLSRDSFGVPCIEGGTLGAVSETIGLVQAQDRLWQIFFVNQLANGRAAQYFGSDFIDSDIFQYQINYTDAEIQSQIDQYLTNKTKVVYQNFVNGLNQYVDQVNANPAILPFELKAIGFDSQSALVPHFTIYDIIRTNQFILQQFSPSSIPSYQLDNLSDLTVLTDNFGDNKAKKIFNDIDPTTRQVNSQFTVVPGVCSASKTAKEKSVVASSLHQFTGHAKKLTNKLKGIRKLHKKSGLPTMGSNGAVIRAEKSKSGNPLIRIAPQPNFNQPSDFYQIRVDHNNAGFRGNFFTIPSIPMTALGVFNQYGVAVEVGHLPSNDFLFESMDNIDQSKTRTVTIQVLEGPDVTFDVYKSTSGGWVIQTDSETNTMITLRSVFMGRQLSALNLFVEAAFAKSFNEFKNTLLNPSHQSDILLLEGQYVDSQNNIAVFHTGGWTSLPPRYDRRFPQGIDGFLTPSNNAYSYQTIAQNPLTDSNCDQGYYVAWNSLFKQGAAGSDDTVGGIGVNRMYWLDQAIKAQSKLSFADLKKLNLRQCLANSNTQLRDDDLDYDADLFSILFKDYFFGAVQRHPTADRLRAVSLLRNYEGNWFEGNTNQILNGSDVSDKALLASVWLNNVTSQILNPFIGGTTREVAVSTVQDPLPNENAAENSNSLVGPGNTLSRILKVACDNKVFFNGWLNNQPSIDQIITTALDSALNILGGFDARPWGHGKRGVYQFNNLVLGPVQSMNVFNASGFYMVAEFLPNSIRMETVLALGESGEILGDPESGDPQFNPHCFDQQPLYSQLEFRQNPPFVN